MDFDFKVRRRNHLLNVLLQEKTVLIFGLINKFRVDLMTGLNSIMNVKCMRGICLV